MLLTYLFAMSHSMNFMQMEVSEKRVLKILFLGLNDTEKTARPSHLWGHFVSWESSRSTPCISFIDNIERPGVSPGRRTSYEGRNGILLQWG